ncbi:MAG TPA: helix-turn-helix domain-containing protein [Alphaproteobacteria bacterium]|nr:helix-turn-helix domain-containing protein [Alphaproteobacteria bacterium]
MQKDIMDLLHRLGLKSREARIYMTCLSFKEGLFIHEIAKHTRITRSTVDLTARRLTQRGFLNKIKTGRRFRFFATAPETVLFRQKQLAEDLEQAVPMLSKIGGAKKDMEILYFEGAQGFRQVHDDALPQIKFASDQKKDLLSFSSGADSMRLFPNMQKQFIDKRIKYGSWYRVIAPTSSKNVPEWMDEPKALRAAKYIPDESYNFPIDIQIYADTVMLYSTTPPIGGVTIRNEKIANSMRMLFQLVWKSLPENKK